MIEARFAGTHALLGLMGAAAIFLACVVTLPYLAGLRAGLLEDDSYFYAQLAYNAPKTGTFTFDGLNLTSGFHPLWGLILCGAASLLSVFTADKVLHLSGYLTVWFLVAVALTFRVGKCMQHRLVFFALLLLTAPLMETSLLSLILVVIVEYIEQPRPMVVDGSRPDFAVAGLSMLVPVTRIDASIILLVWILRSATTEGCLYLSPSGSFSGLRSTSPSWVQCSRVSSFLKAGPLDPWRVARSLGETWNAGANRRPRIARGVPNLEETIVGSFRSLTALDCAVA